MITLSSNFSKQNWGLDDKEVQIPTSGLDNEGARFHTESFVLEELKCKY